MELEFLYTDSNGAKSKRLITGIKVVKSDTGHIYFKAFDLNAKGVRLFRTDRIEYIDGVMPEWVEALPMHGIYRREKSEDQLKIKVHFTGFPRKDVLPFLQKSAADAGILVRKSVTNDLDFLVTGYNAGPKKLEKARGLKKCIILTEEGFLNLLETGEIDNNL